MAFLGEPPVSPQATFPPNFFLWFRPQKTLPPAGRPLQGDWEAEVSLSGAQPPSSHHHVTMSHIILDRSWQRQDGGSG